jgi:elongation factor Ts
LREKTGAGVLDCRNALIEGEGDFEKAAEQLRHKGLAEAAKRKDRETKEGIIASYIHAGDRIGTMIELNCETDFVAATDEFRNLAKELTLQVAAASPLYVSRDDVPEGVLEEKKAEALAEFKDSNKPPHIVERIVAGKLDKYYEEFCLLEQSYIRDPDLKVREVLDRVNAILGENLAVRRFVRYELGK